MNEGQTNEVLLYWDSATGVMCLNLLISIVGFYYYNPNQAMITSVAIYVVCKSTFLWHYKSC